MQGTRYSIQSMIEDTQIQKFRVTQEIFVLVFRNLDGIIIEDELRMMRNLLQTTLQEFSSKELTDDITGKKKSAWSGKNLSIKSLGDGSLLGKITRIDEYGLVTIRFNKNVLKFENITQIDKTVLNVFAISSYYPNDQR